MKNALLVFMAIALLSSCAAKKTETKTKITQVVLIPPPVNTATARDGSSIEKALIIIQEHEMAGVNAEYAFLKATYPGYKTGSQSLVYNNKKPYDVIKITTADGKPVTVYFDISNFYGKF